MSTVVSAALSCQAELVEACRRVGSHFKAARYVLRATRSDD
jgi:hypothetical protein